MLFESMFVAALLPPAARGWFNINAPCTLSEHCWFVWADGIDWISLSFGQDMKELSLTVCGCPSLRVLKHHSWIPSTTYRSCFAEWTLFSNNSIEGIRCLNWVSTKNEVVLQHHHQHHFATARGANVFSSQKINNRWSKIHLSELSGAPIQRSNALLW